MILNYPSLITVVSVNNLYEILYGLSGSQIRLSKKMHQGTAHLEYKITFIFLCRLPFLISIWFWMKRICHYYIFLLGGGKEINLKTSNFFVFCPWIVDDIG